MGLWEPLKPAPPQAATQTTKKHHRAAAKHHARRKPQRGAAASRRLTVSPQVAETAPGPPVPARMAFLVAALAAFLAALVSVLQSRTSIRVFRESLVAIGPRAAQVVRPARAPRVAIARPRLPQVAAGELIAPVKRHAADVTGQLVGALRKTPRVTRDWLARLKAVAAPRLHTLAVAVGRAAQSSRAGGRAAFVAAADGSWEVRERWAVRRRGRGLAPYLVSFAVAVVVGWFVGAH